ncbi:MAG: SMC-Scp complex subunit ScpB [Bdellovibrionales bacterium]|nr:SMC-Scp complex subunit ScpB [Bdellovibrionales bacterium]
MFDNEDVMDTAAAPEDSENFQLTSQEEAPVEFIDSFQLLSILEGLFFASQKPLSFSMVKQIFVGTNVDNRQLKSAIEQLQVILADPTRGVTLDEVVGGYQLRTKMDNMEFLKRINKARPFRLSGPALEVLSIIAYKQPIIKNEVDQIRGVESGHLVRALMEKGLVNFQGKAEDLPGKPMSYGTTRKFLEIFGLRNLEELPSLSEIDQLIPEGIGDEEEKETLSSVTEGMSAQIGTSYSEGEEELLNIVQKLDTIDTSSEFFEEEKRRQKEKRDREKAEDLREAIAVGELVDKKDRRWLEKYEAQQALAQQAKEMAALSQESEATLQAQSTEELEVASIEDVAEIAETFEDEDSSSEESTENDV